MAGGADVQGQFGGRTFRHEQAADGVATDGFRKVISLVCLVARRCHDNLSRPGDGCGVTLSERVIIGYVIRSADAEVHNTRHTHAVGVVKHILEGLHIYDVGDGILQLL